MLDAVAVDQTQEDTQDDTASHDPESKGKALATREKISADGALQIAQSYVIDCIEMAEAAAEDLADFMGRMKKLEETRLSITRPMDESKRRVMELFEPPKTMWQLCIDELKPKIAEWNRKEDARIEAERLAQEEAANKIAAEAREQAKKLEQIAQDAAASGDPVATQEAEQNHAAAIMVADTIQHMAPVVVTKTKLAGVSSREAYKAEVTDLMALVKAVAAGTASIALLEANTKVINQQVAALKSEFKVPGIRVYTTDVVSVRAKR